MPYLCIHAAVLLVISCGIICYQRRRSKGLYQLHGAKHHRPDSLLPQGTLVHNETAVYENMPDNTLPEAQEMSAKTFQASQQTCAVSTATVVKEDCTFYEDVRPAVESVYEMDDEMDNKTEEDALQQTSPSAVASHTQSNMKQQDNPPEISDTEPLYVMDDVMENDGERQMTSSGYSVVPNRDPAPTDRGYLPVVR